jgi:hypothetical protein
MARRFPSTEVRSASPERKTVPPWGALRYARAGLAMNFGRQSRSRGAELLVALFALALPLKAAGCGRTACFTVTSSQLVQGACPGVNIAERRLEGTDCATQERIATVDGPGTLDNDLCCYPVTFADSNSGPMPCGGGGSSTVTTVGFAVGVGASGTASGPSCLSCNVFLAGMSGPLCSSGPTPAIDAEIALQDCACAAASCQADCAATLCGVGNAPDDACRACLLQACAMEVTACKQS